MMKFFVIIFLTSLSVFSLEPNPYFKTEADIDKFFVDSSVQVPEEGRGGFRIDIKNDNVIVEIGNSCLCREDWGAIFTFDWYKESIVRGDGYILGINFENEKSLSSIPNNQYTKAMIAAKYLICKFVKNHINAIHTDGIKDFKENGGGGKSTSDSRSAVEKMAWLFYPITNKNVSIYNDLGFFLEQGKKYQYAVTLLEQVIKAVPSRTVAYVNLGDAYWGLKKIDEAKKCYVTYIDLMKKEGKENKIPSVVLDRLKYK